MKKSVAGAILLASSFLAAVNAQATEENDPAIHGMVEFLSDKYESFYGVPLTDKDKEGLKGSLKESFNNNIREGYCREVRYSITRGAMYLSVKADVCRIDDNFVIGPKGIHPN
jgi:hypothetical protein